MNLEADAEVKDFATYWRAAYIKDMHNQAFSVGLIGMNAELRAVDSSGAGDHNFRPASARGRVDLGGPCGR